MTDEKQLHAAVVAYSAAHRRLKAMEGAHVPVISVNDLVKTFRVPIQQAGTWGSPFVGRVVG